MDATENKKHKKPSNFFMGSSGSEKDSHDMHTDARSKYGGKEDFSAEQKSAAGGKADKRRESDAGKTDKWREFDDFQTLDDSDSASYVSKQNKANQDIHGGLSPRGADSEYSYTYGHGSIAHSDSIDTKKGSNSAKSNSKTSHQDEASGSNFFVSPFSSTKPSEVSRENSSSGLTAAQNDSSSKDDAHHGQKRAPRNSDAAMRDGSHTDLNLSHSTRDKKNDRYAAGSALNTPDLYNSSNNHGHEYSSFFSSGSSKSNKETASASSGSASSTTKPIQDNNNRDTSFFKPNSGPSSTSNNSNTHTGDTDTKISSNNNNNNKRLDVFGIGLVEPSSEALEAAAKALRNIGRTTTQTQNNTSFANSSSSSNNNNNNNNNSGSSIGSGSTVGKSTSVTPVSVLVSSPIFRRRYIQKNVFLCMYVCIVRRYIQKNVFAYIYVCTKCLFVYVHMHCT
jgi:hypothetical protein